MWITIATKKTEETKTCERCGSDRGISRTWTETHETYTGTKVVECSQIICSNEECQKMFDDRLQDEQQKRELIQKAKLEKEAQRKKPRQAITT